MADGAEIRTEVLENGIIGAICIDPNLIRPLGGVVHSEDFSSDLCKAIFDKAISSLTSDGVFDAVIAADAVAGTLGEQQAREYVLELMRQTPTTANAEYYAGLLHKRSTFARMKSQLVNIIMDSDESTDPADFSASVITKCRELLNSEKTGHTVTLNKAIEKLYLGLGESKGIVRCDTGFERLDKYLKGIWSGNLCVIAARPGVGKSAMALSIAENVARNTGKVLIYSMEMLDVELAERIIVRDGKITLDSLIDSEKLTEDDYGLVIESMKRKYDLPILINDSPNMTVSKIRREAATIDGLKMIIVDFLSLMKADGKYEKRYLEIGAISRELKMLAVELNIPIVVLCQLNREREASERPTLANLRDSGEIEQNANKILMMWYEDEEHHIVGVSVAKNRRGKTGAAKYYFDGDHMTFTEIDELHEEPNSGKKRSSYKGGSEQAPW